MSIHQNLLWKNQWLIGVDIVGRATGDRLCASPWGFAGDGARRSRQDLLTAWHLITLSVEHGQWLTRFQPHTSSEL